jgi:hypothetical protein
LFLSVSTKPQQFSFGFLNFSIPFIKIAQFNQGMVITKSSEHLGSGPRIRLNATFIIDSPQQRFLTATDLGAGTPDFHQPERFPLVDLA